MVATARYEIKATDRTKSAVKSATRGMERLKKSVFSLKGALLALGGIGFGRAIKSSLEYADKIAKTADVVGISTEALQEWRFAAVQSGVSQDTLTQSLIAFTKRIGEARAGKGALVTQLKDHNKELLTSIINSKNMDEAMVILFKNMGKLETQFDKSALASAAFSRAGVSLTNMVKTSYENIAILRKQARSLGIVLEDKVLRASEKTTDKLEILSRVMRVQFLSVLEAIMPQLNRLSDSLVKGRSGLKAIAGVLTGLFSFIVANPILSSVGVVGFFLLGWKGRAVLFSVLASLKAVKALFGELTAAAETASQKQTRQMLEVKTASERVLPKLKKHLAFLVGVRDEHIKMGRNVPRVLERNINKTSKKLSIATERYEKAVKSFKEVFKKPVTEKPSDKPGGVTTTKLNIFSTKKKNTLDNDLKILQQSLLNEKELLDQNTTDKILKIDELWEAKKISLTTRNDWMAETERLHQEKLTDINQKAAEDRIKTEHKTQDLIKQARQGAVSAGLGLLGFFAQRSKKAAMAQIIVNKALAIGQAIQNTAVGVTKALTVDPTGALAARVAFLGKVQIGLIAATGLGELSQAGKDFSGGGLSIGGGGSPGTLAPGSPAEGTSSSKVININLGDDDDLISKSAVRKFIEKINVELGDGATLLVG